MGGFHLSISKLLLVAGVIAPFDVASGEISTVQFRGLKVKRRLTEGYDFSYCAKWIENASTHGWGIEFYDRAVQKGSKREPMSIGWSSYEQAIELLINKSTPSVLIKKRESSCTGSELSDVWFYPTEDHNGAYQIGNHECMRMQHMLLRTEVSCVYIYRVSTAQEVMQALDWYHDDATIEQASIGGHGEDAIDDSGVLALGPDDDDDENTQSDPFHSVTLAAHSTSTQQMLRILEQKLVKHPTIMVDSCFSGVNGLAKAVSKAIKNAWVFGGVVSLTSDIEIIDTPFPRGSKDGPQRLFTEYSDAAVRNASGTDADLNEEEPENDSNLLATYFGERVVAFHNGTEQGPVTQWRWLSKNGTVIRIGDRVVTTEEIRGFRAGLMTLMYGTKKTALGTWNPLPVGLTGQVVFMNTVGNVPVEGSALIVWDLPKTWQQSGDAGSSLGPMIVLPGDFHMLQVLSA